MLLISNKIFFLVLYSNLFLNFMDLTNIIGSKSQKKIYLGKKIASSGEGDIYQGDDGK